MKFEQVVPPDVEFDHALHSALLCVIIVHGKSEQSKDLQGEDL